MVSAGLQLLGTALAILGWIGVIVVCAIPMWKVTAFIGSNIITAQTSWEGIWMNCVVQSTGQMQCKVYDSMLALSSDLQAARALTIISIVIGILGIMLAMAGGKCTNSHVIIQDFYNPLLNQAQKRELGAALYIGWGAAALLIIGGGLLCCTKYNAPSRSEASAPSDHN
uniref:Claudin b n=1 Tax=Sinocyclocheilus grahami TaxID=75366 RepID=A0A672SRJ6_SINGR